MKYTLKISSLEDLNRVAPGFANVWRALKADTQSSVRRPKTVTVTDEPHAMMPNDSSCAARYVVDLATMKIEGSRHVSCGEWAMANKGQEHAIVGIPSGKAVVSCEWNDYYRFFSMTVEVRPGTLIAQIEEHYQEG